MERKRFLYITNKDRKEKRDTKIKKEITKRFIGLLNMI